MDKNPDCCPKFFIEKDNRIKKGKNKCISEKYAELYQDTEMTADRIFDERNNIISVLK